MRLSVILITAALAASLTFGQNPPAEAKAVQLANQEPSEAEIIHVKTLTGDSFDRLVKLLGVFNARLQADQQLRTIVVYAPKDVVEQMRRVVAELDSPGSEAAIGRNIEMTMTFLRCSTKPPATTKALPDDIEPVAKQLRASTQYKDIQLWDGVPLRLQEGKTTVENMMLPGPDSTPGQPTVMSIRVEPEAATRKGPTWSVRFRQMSISFRVPVATGSFSGPDSKAVNTQFTYQDVGITTSGDFLDGQKTVLGKLSGTENDSAIFVVISLKVLD